VADLVNTGSANPSEMLCPTNPLRALEKVNDMLGKDTTDAKDGAPAPRTACGACYLNNLNWGGTAANTMQRADFIARTMFDKGYNTNYVASWYLVRGGIKFEPGVNPLVSMSVASAPPGSSGYKGIGMTTGPLTRRVVESSRVVSSNVPLLGDAAPGDPSEAILSLSIVKDPALNTLGNADTEHRTYLEAGERLAESFNDGPARFDPSVPKLQLMPQLTPVQAQMILEASTQGPPPATVAGGGWLQDTRDWYAVHGSGNQLSCNILMADGSVKEFVDSNGDRYLNPGFPIPNDLSEVQYAGIGYKDSTIELHPKDIYSGIFLTGDVGKSTDFE
jgi:prepilin-type processing-associated H-X9-DG protein